MSEFISKNPATGEIIWQGPEADEQQISQAVAQAKKAFESWGLFPYERRISCLNAFADALKQNQKNLAETISVETGKPLWESHLEISSMIMKVSISIAAAAERCPTREINSTYAAYTLHHKPHGAIAVFGPFNFPGHLPNGHIVPALLAGNTVVFKASEQTPLISEKISNIWKKILPEDVFHLIQGGPKVGRYLLQCPIDGLFFTGSYKTGKAILEGLGNDPEKILSLEMGGNNPLVVHDFEDPNAAAYTIIQSAFLTSGQRCSCARRLIVVEGKHNENLIHTLIRMMRSIKVGAYTDHPEPFMGPVISLESCQNLLKAQENLEKLGGKSLVKMQVLKDNTPFLSPGLMDVSAVRDLPDEEYFGPFLQLIRVKSFEEAIVKANETQYGLTACLLSQDKEKYKQFFHHIKAGIINWNQPTTGANSRLPFGGVKKSGNHRPSAYYAADYCAYPVASAESPMIFFPKDVFPGITIDAGT